MIAATLDTATVRRWKRYPEYRAVCTETLFKLPTHWRTNRLKFVTRINPEVLGEDTHPDYELQYIDISNVDSLGRVHEEQTFRFEDAPSRARRRVRHGDVLISTVRTYLRAITAIENPPDNLIVSTGFAALRPGKEYEPRFLWRLIQSNEFVDSVVNHSGGVGYPAINPTELGGLPVWVPPLPEQRAIAAFLDRETARIDASIGHKERLIALLEEKRQAVISHAVTRGLDPAAPLKDSGTELYPAVPMHWSLTRVRYLCKQVSDGPHYSPLYVDVGDGVMFISARNVKVDRWSLDDAKYVSKEDFAEFCKRVTPKKGDVLYTKGGTTGIARVVDLDVPFHVWVHIAVLKIHTTKVNPFFLAYALNGMGCYSQSQLYTRGATNNDLGLTRLINIVLAVPTLEEQENIIRYLDRVTSQIDGIIHKIRDGITPLQEYRVALISAAVTGQIDVRDQVECTKKETIP